MQNYHKILTGIFLYLLTTITIAATIPQNLLHDKDDPIVGNPNGKITLVEFFDYQCLHCTNMSATMQHIAKKYPKLRIIFKEFPIRGSISEYAARAALAANKQGKYPSLHHALMNTTYQLSENNILEIAKQGGLNISQLEKDIASQSIINHVENNLNLARDLEINGTPTFIISKSDATSIDELNIIMGEISQSEIERLIRVATRK